MGSKNDWCSSKGLAARKKGMEKKEGKTAKCCYLVIFVLSAIIYIVLGALHGNRSENAEKINEEFGMFSSYPLNAYDGCNIPTFTPDSDVSVRELAQLSEDYEKHCDGKEEECREKGTEWTMAWSFNASIMIIQGINFIVLSIGAFYFYPRLIGTFCNFCLGCCHLSAFSVALSTRYSAPGAICAINISPNQYDEDKGWDDEWTY